MTEHEKLVERVARAMAKDANDHFDQVRLFYMKRARAALAEVYAALREPTPEMRRAGAAVAGGLNGSGCYVSPKCQAADNQCECEIDAANTYQPMLQASPLNPEN